MVVLGRVIAPYGVQGWIRLHPFGDDPARWAEIRQWWLGRDECDFSAWRGYPLQALRLQGKSWVAKFVGIDDRNGAEQLVGHYVGAPRSALPVTDPDEYYWADLVGLRVVNEKQESLGAVAELIESGAHAVMVVVDGEKKSLLPFVAAVVKEVDVAAGLMRVDWERDW
jgi:16S rRNA processing protein RimM